MRYLVVTALLAILASCLTQSDEEIRADLEKTSSFTQELSVCASSCDSPYNGVPVSCASNYGCYSDAAGAYCWQGGYWQNVYCISLCGNGICDAGEPTSCPQDCSGGGGGGGGGGGYCYPRGLCPEEP